MLSKHKLLILLAGLIFALQGFYAPVASSAPVTVDSETLQRLENLISAQQKQLESLQEEVNQLKQQKMQQPAVAGTGQGPAAAPPAKVVTSGEEKVKLAISGQINRALSIADDGDKT
ncbi:MAG: hypothetical protein PVF84_02500, partial [Desulfuromonadales bacterium]